MIVSNLSLPPQEITFTEVKHYFAWCYRDATAADKIKLKTWRLHCEGYMKASRACPRFTTFDQLADLKTYTDAIRSGLLCLNDVGGADKAVDIIVKSAGS